ncbi:hypothetical protein BGZ61DRAFT_96042 [Ilyonectria robusta]|uniref:uncharacterized protein n=1 Tax=Ilyonectria robusta TaxID=1079257 RepID=UPI001E8E56C5|nr:uncharacterized protein BGZ61DRAFT_96042 [Ilyonectria robusta]KAH8736526.1 hypothetical protein BGZ61DRAFT_96042 [Ilyonectria robusta]
MKLSSIARTRQGDAESEGVRGVARARVSSISQSLSRVKGVVEARLDERERGKEATWTVEARRSGIKGSAGFAEGANGGGNDEPSSSCVTGCRPGSRESLVARMLEVGKKEIRMARPVGLVVLRPDPEVYYYGCGRTGRGLGADWAHTGTRTRTRRGGWEEGGRSARRTSVARSGLKGIGRRGWRRCSAVPDGEKSSRNRWSSPALCGRV